MALISDDRHNFGQLCRDAIKSILGGVKTHTAAFRPSTNRFASACQVDEKGAMAFNHQARRGSYPPFTSLIMLLLTSWAPAARCPFASIGTTLRGSKNGLSWQSLWRNTVLSTRVTQATPTLPSPPCASPTFTTLVPPSSGGSQAEIIAGSNYTETINPHCTPISRLIPKTLYIHWQAY